MGKKKTKKRLRNHEQHHANIHNWIMQHSQSGDGASEQHVMPVAQPWHVASNTCWCIPTLTFESPYNGAKIYTHTFIIH